MCKFLAVENGNEIAAEYHYILMCPFLMNKGNFF